MLSRLRSLWHNLRHRDRADHDLDDEVRAMFDLLVEEKVRDGLTREQARRAATLELGRVDAVTQQVREERAGASIDALLQDLRYGARMLRANPGFTAVVTLSLAVGIGANSALFSVANALLLRALPVPDPDTLYMAAYEARVPVPQQVSYPFFEQLRAGFPHPNDIAAMSRVMRVQAAGEGEPAPANMQLVSGEFFDTLRLRTSQGRLLTADDNRIVGGHPVAVISDRFWRARFNAAADIVGRDLSLNGARFTIVGVTPPGFDGVWLETLVDAWIPLAMQGEVRYFGNFSASNADLQKHWMPQDGIRWLEAIVRADRADGAEAAALNAVFRPTLLREADDITDPERRQQILDQSMILEPFAQGASALRTRFKTPLFVLMTMVAVLLVVACVNTANLLLARSAARQREMAVRLSLGATRPRVIRQLLTESALLSIIAAAAGLAIAPAAAQLLVRSTIGLESGPLPFDVGVDSRVVIFTALLALSTGLLFGLAPAWRASDPAIASTLKAHSRGTRSGSRLNLSKALVVAQVALSLLLVAASGLFLQSIGNLASVPLGFDAEHVVSASINPRTGGYGEDDLAPLYRRVVERAEALPGVDAAAIATCGLMTGCRSSAHGLVIAGYQPQPGEEISLQENQVTAGYVRAAGMTLIAGRDLTDRDHGARVALINEALAERYFRGRNAVGERLGREAADTEIIGVVRDARVNTVKQAPEPMVLFPVATHPGFLGTLLVRTSGEPAAIVTGLRRAIQDVEPALPVDRVTTVSGLAAATFRQETLIARLTTVLSAIALALACLGLYGLMSYAVKQRTGELGIRFALGASRLRVLWMVLRESMVLIVAGLAIGYPLVLAGSRALGTLLFEVSGDDPRVIGGAMAVLLIVGATASYVPSWRASRVDPLRALGDQ